MATIPLLHLAHARSGDKGDTANVGVIAYDPAHYDLLRDALTVERVEEHFGLEGSVDIKMGTLSKTIPSVGGYVAGKKQKGAAAETMLPGSSAYPNPFNPSTTITWKLTEPADVRLAVYDVMGREVRVLVSGPAAAGTHEARFDAGDLPSGVYFSRLQVGDVVESVRLVLTK